MYRHDEPIDIPEEDKLLRTDFSRRLGDAILKSPTKSGYVIALNGAWGTGKTSVLKLTQYYLRTTSTAIVLNFNPWFINDSQRIIPDFLEQFQSIQLGSTRLTNIKIQNQIRKYSQVFVPISSILGIQFPVIGIIMSFLTRTRRLLKNNETENSRAKSVKNKITKALMEKKQRIVVFIDDIDRLEISEIEEVSKLVRLIADFPYVTYVLAFDDKIVGKALNAKYIGGDDYLEKIVQQKINLPDVDRIALQNYLFTSLDELMEDFRESITFHHERWPDVYHKIVDQRIESVRDVNRLLNTLRFTCSRIGKHIDLVDLIGLETIRILDSKIYEDIIAIQNDLHKPSWGAYLGSTIHGLTNQKNQIEQSLKNTKLSEIEPILLELFPASATLLKNMQWSVDPSQEWHLQRRVASKELFQLFRTSTESKELKNLFTAESVFNSIQQGLTLKEAIRAANPEDILQVVNALSMFTGKYQVSSAPEVLETILELIPSMVVNESGLFFVDATSIARRTISSILSGFEQLSDRELIVKEVINSSSSLSNLNVFVHIVTSETSRDFISQDLRIEFKEDFSNKVMNTSIADILTERDFISIMHSVPKYVQFAIKDEYFLIQVFKNSVGYSRSSEIGSNLVRKSRSVSWPALIALFGSEESVYKELDSLLGSEDITSEDQELLSWISSQRGKPFPFQNE